MRQEITKDNNIIHVLLHRSHICVGRCVFGEPSGVGHFFCYNIDYAAQIATNCFSIATKAANLQWVISYFDRHQQNYLCASVNDYQASNN